MMNKKRGRPRSSPEVARSERVVTFVTASEFEQINDIAQSGNKPLSLTVYTLLSEQLALKTKSNK